MKFLKSFPLLFLCIGPLLFSQNSETNLLGNSSYASINPLPLGDIHAPRVRIGYVQNINSRWKIGVDLGYGFKFMALDRDLGEAYRLWEVRPEIYRVFNPAAKTIKYVSAEFYYIKQNNVFVNDDYDREDGQGIRYSRADYQRTKYGMHLKFGLFLDIGEHFGFNFYGGVGFRIRNNEYSNVVDAEESGIFREWYSAPQDVEGREVGVNPTLGFKFYYKL